MAEGFSPLTWLGLLLLLYSALRVQGDGMTCHLMHSSDLPGCEETRLLFPKTTTQKYKLVGHAEDAEMVFASRDSNTILLFKPDQEQLQKSVEQDEKDGTYQYLNIELGGRWTFFSKDGTQLADTVVKEFNFMFPPEENEWKICEKNVWFKIPCTVDESSPHVEAGLEGAPCTLLGDCDEGLQCVVVSVMHSVCVRDDEVPADAKVIRGPQPAPPWDNCFFAPPDRKCAVEGFSCYRNSQWESYAQCRPTGDCPRPSASALRAIAQEEGRTDGWSADSSRPTVRPLHTRGTSIQSIHRRLMESDSMTRYQRGKRERERRRRRRRRLQNGSAESEAVEEEQREEEDRRRRLEKCLDDFKKQGGKGRQTEGQGEEGNVGVGSADFSYGDGAPDVRVSAVGRVEVKLCGDWMDFSEVEGVHSSSSSPFGFGQEEEGEGGEEEKEVDLSLNLPEEDEIDVGWTYGWDCGSPLGSSHIPIPSEEGKLGVLSRQEARMLFEDQGLIVEEAVPLTRQEEAEQQKREWGEVGSLSFFDTATNAPMPAAPSPPPPPTKKKRGWVMKCHPDVPVYSGAPGKPLAPVLSCAPRLNFGPGINLGTIWVFAPVSQFAPGISLAPTFFFGPLLRVSTSYNNAYRMWFGPVLRLAPTFAIGVTFGFAPILSLIPAANLGTAILLTPLLVNADIFSDFWFERTDFDPPKETPTSKLDPVSTFNAEEDPKFDAKSAYEWTGEDLTPVIRTVRLVRGQRLPTLPKWVEGFGIKRSLRLGNFFVTNTLLWVNCPRKVIASPDQRPGTTKVLYVFPRDAGRHLLSRACVLPYPSDVLRDVPHLPPQAIYGIRMLEAIERLLPPELRVAVNIGLSFGEVLGSGGIPDLERWVDEFGAEEPTGTIEGTTAAAPLCVSCATVSVGAKRPPVQFRADSFSLINLGPETGLACGGLSPCSGDFLEEDTGVSVQERVNIGGALPEGRPSADFVDDSRRRLVGDRWWGGRGRQNGGRRRSLAHASASRGLKSDAALHEDRVIASLKPFSRYSRMKNQPAAYEPFLDRLANRTEEKSDLFVEKREQFIDHLPWEDPIQKLLNKKNMTMQDRCEATFGTGNFSESVCNFREEARPNCTEPFNPDSFGCCNCCNLDLLQYNPPERLIYPPFAIGPRELCFNVMSSPSSEQECKFSEFAAQAFNDDEIFYCADLTIAVNSQNGDLNALTEPPCCKINNYNMTPPGKPCECEGGAEDSIFCFGSPCTCTGPPTNCDEENCYFDDEVCECGGGTGDASTRFCRGKPCYCLGEPVCDEQGCRYPEGTGPCFCGSIAGSLRREIDFTQCGHENCFCEEPCVPNGPDDTTCQYNGTARCSCPTTGDPQDLFFGYCEAKSCTCEATSNATFDVIYRGGCAAFDDEFPEFIFQCTDVELDGRLLCDFLSPAEEFCPLVAAAEEGINDDSELDAVGDAGRLSDRAPTNVTSVGTAVEVQGGRMPFSMLTWSKAIKKAMSKVSPEYLANLPPLFPSWSATMKRAKEMAESLANKVRDHLSAPAGSFFPFRAPAVFGTASPLKGLLPTSPVPLFERRSADDRQSTKEGSKGEEEEEQPQEEAFSKLLSILPFNLPSPSLDDDRVKPDHETSEEPSFLLDSLSLPQIPILDFGNLFGTPKDSKALPRDSDEDGDKTTGWGGLKIGTLNGGGDFGFRRFEGLGELGGKIGGPNVPSISPHTQPRTESSKSIFKDGLEDPLVSEQALPGGKEGGNLLPAGDGFFSPGQNFFSEDSYSEDKVVRVEALKEDSPLAIRRPQCRTNGDCGGMLDCEEGQCCSRTLGPCQNSGDCCTTSVCSSNGLCKVPLGGRCALALDSSQCADGLECGPDSLTCCLRTSVPCTNGGDCCSGVCSQFSGVCADRDPEGPTDCADVGQAGLSVSVSLRDVTSGGGTGLRRYPFFAEGNAALLDFTFTHIENTNTGGQPKVAVAGLPLPPAVVDSFLDSQAASGSVSVSVMAERETFDPQSACLNGGMPVFDPEQGGWKLECNTAPGDSFSLRLSFDNLISCPGCAVDVSFSDSVQCSPPAVKSLPFFVQPTVEKLPRRQVS